MPLCEAPPVCWSSALFCLCLCICVCELSILSAVEYSWSQMGQNCLTLILLDRPSKDLLWICKTLCSYGHSNINIKPKVHICFISFFPVFMSLYLVNRHQLPRLSDWWSQFSELVQSAFPRASSWACGERQPNSYNHSSSRRGPNRG